MKSFASSLVICGSVLFGCGQDTPCITPPPTTNKTTDTGAEELSVKLEKLAIDADIKNSFSKTAEAGYQKLSDDNVTLYLLLSAVDCYLKHGKVAMPLAEELVDIARSKYGTKKGSAGTVGKRLSSLEIEGISQSSSAALIFARLQEFGVER